MMIETNIKKYIVLSGEKLINVLNKINDNKSRIVFVTEDNGVLIGVISDGDVRRWMTSSSKMTLDIALDEVMNRDYISYPIKGFQNKIIRNIPKDRSLIPLTDERGRILAVVRMDENGFQLGGKKINSYGSAFIIAEVGNNHNGDFELGKQLIESAVAAKADCVKFQMRNLKTLYSNGGKNAESKYDLGSQYTLDLLNKFQLSNDKLCQLFEYARSLGILPLCTPWDIESVAVLEEYGMEGYKVASADLTNSELLKVLAKTNKPLICSTGMSKETEIKESVEILRQMAAQYAFLHCNSTYPTPFKDVNLKYLNRLQELTGEVVGYSGHERGIEIPLAAVALGAKIVEKHITLDKTMEGNDHKVSLTPNEFTDMVIKIRNIEEAMGTNDERDLTQGEMINRENLAKSIVINRDLDVGEKIEREMLIIRSPGIGIQPNRINDVVGKRVLRPLLKDSIIFDTDINENESKKNKYKFNRPYGIPVRYHDYKELIQDVDVDFVEFHLSYQDLDIKPQEYIQSKESIGCAIHAPELFSNDHILDLASRNPEYLERSISELNKTTNVAREIAKLFPKTAKPVLVLNAGGWSTEGFQPVAERTASYKRIATALKRVNLDNLDLAIQTMPPFPWHFGGQSYHNLFIDPNEITSFAEKTGYRICLDVSHSMMACNHFGWKLEEFLEKVLPYTIHLHIVDAKGTDGEGIQIGKGDVNFFNLSEYLNKFAPNVPFIPEVWQGHKDRGAGFWAALEYLERFDI